MVDTKNNINDSVKEMHDFLDTIEVDEEKRKNIDLSYLDDKEK